MEQPLRLLVVDDDRLFRHLWRHVAEEMGIEVLEAGSPDHARKLMQQVPPTVIVLDVLFPEGSGLDFLHELRHDERWQSIPVIVCSGVAQQEIVLQSAREGICHYLLKPFRLEEAQSRLRMVLQRRGLWPQAPPEPQKRDSDRHSTSTPEAP